MARYVNLMSEALRRYQREENIDQIQMGRLLGIERLAVRNLELGAQQPSFRTLRAAAALFQWTPEDVGQVVLALPDERRMYYDDNGVRPDRPGAAVPQEGERAVLGGLVTPDPTGPSDPGSTES